MYICLNFSWPYFARCCSLCLLAQNPTGTLVPPDKLEVDTSGKRDIIGVGIKLLHLHI